MQIVPLVFKKIPLRIHQNTPFLAKISTVGERPSPFSDPRPHLQWTPLLAHKQTFWIRLCLPRIATRFTPMRAQPVERADYCHSSSLKLAYYKVIGRQKNITSVTVLSEVYLGYVKQLWTSAVGRPTGSAVIEQPCDPSCHLKILF